MSYTQLTENERYQIYGMNKADHSQKDIAYFLKRSPSTICRERQRNHGLRGYKPLQAQKKSDERRKLKGAVTNPAYLSVVESCRSGFSRE